MKVPQDLSAHSKAHRLYVESRASLNPQASPRQGPLALPVKHREIHEVQRLLASLVPDVHYTIDAHLQAITCEGPPRALGQVAELIAQLDRATRIEFQAYANQLAATKMLARFKAQKELIQVKKAPRGTVLFRKTSTADGDITTGFLTNQHQYLFFTASIPRGEEHADVLDEILNSARWKRL